MSSNYINRNLKYETFYFIFNAKDFFFTYSNWFYLSISGILLYEMLYGYTPFRGKTRQKTFANVLKKDLKFPRSIQVNSSVFKSFSFESITLYVCMYVCMYVCKTIKKKRKKNPQIAFNLYAQLSNTTSLNFLG